MRTKKRTWKKVVAAVLALSVMVSLVSYDEISIKAETTEVTAQETVTEETTETEEKSETEAVTETEAETETETEEENRKSLFCNIIQYEDPQALLKRLHQLIDGKKGADVGCVLLKCKQDGYIPRNPTQAEFKSEFALKGTWQAIHNYLNEDDMNALDRANKVIIFE